MSQFNELLQNLVNDDYETLVFKGQESCRRLLPVCAKFDPDHDGVILLSYVVLSAVCADGKFSDLEQRYITDIMGLQGEQLKAFLDMRDKEMYDMVDKFADVLDAEQKAVVIMLAAATCAVDERITANETAFLRKLLEA